MLIADWPRCKRLGATCGWRPPWGQPTQGGSEDVIRDKWERILCSEKNLIKFCYVADRCGMPKRWPKGNERCWSDGGRGGGEDWLVRYVWGNKDPVTVFQITCVNAQTLFSLRFSWMTGTPTRIKVRPVHSNQALPPLKLFKLEVFGDVTASLPAT